MDNLQMQLDSPTAHRSFHTAELAELRRFTLEN